MLRKPSLDLAQMVALLKAPKSTVSAAHALLEGASPSVALAALGLDKLRDRLLAAIEEDGMSWCAEEDRKRGGEAETETEVTDSAETEGCLFRSLDSAPLWTTLVLSLCIPWCYNGG